MSNSEFVRVPRLWLEDVISIDVPRTRKALENFKALLSQPAERHQGELVKYLDLVSGNVFDDAEPIEQAGRRAIPVADPREVERLRERIKELESVEPEWSAIQQKLGDENEALRVQLAKLQKDCDSFEDQAFTLREGLKGVLGWIECSQSTSALRSIVEKSLSASAEQSATVANCTNEDSWNCKYCMKTESCSALKDPRNFGAPAERDERAAFVAEMRKKGGLIEWALGWDGARFEHPPTQGKWEIWQMRAALEGKQ